MGNMNLIVIATLTLGGLSQSVWAASTKPNSGTQLTAASDAASIQCLDNDTALVDIATTVTSSGAVDSAEIKIAIDGDVPKTSGWIDPQDYIHNGRYKTAVSSFSQVFQNGSHSYSSCFVQSGAHGRLSKQTCAAPVNFEVSCAPIDVCRDVEVFGNVIGNGNLCAGQAIPIHIKGSFGEGGDLVITKGSFSKTIRADRSGNSCVYQAQYRPTDDGNAGAGSYSFSLFGDNGSVYSFSANLKCK